MIHARLAAVGLVKARRDSNVTVDQMLVEFLASLTIKVGAKITYKQTRTSLVEYSGPTCCCGTSGR